jgi:purine-binding chemotaxis protein CheW
LSGLAHARVTPDRDRSSHEPVGEALVTALSVLVGGHPYLINVMSVREIRGWSQPVPFPGCPAWIEGMCDLRGNVIPVISMVARLGLDRTPGPPTVTVVVEVHGRLLGVAVDGVCDLVSIPADRFQPTPAAGGAAARELLSAVVELEGRVFGLVDFDQLTPIETLGGPEPVGGSHV